MNVYRSVRLHLGISASLHRLVSALVRFLKKGVVALPTGPTLVHSSSETAASVSQPSWIRGFYRCTDILYQYHPSLKNTRDAVQLQKILSYNAILHPRHPLAAEGPIPGIQAYIGTFHDGQARLLFSSAQVEYLRYWLFSMRLTEGLIPLPYSDCMFVDVTSVSPIVFENPAALSITSKKLGRMNQYLKEKPVLVGRRFMFERVRALWTAKRGVWCALNLSAWELDHTAISDVGWSLTCWEDASESTQRTHLVVKENQAYKKTDLQDDVEIEMVTKTTLKRKINDLFSELGDHAPVFLVSNDSKGDLKYLQSNAFQVPLPDLVHELPSVMPTSGIFLIDLPELFNALTGSGDPNTDNHSLEYICKHLKIPCCGVRNAGTDAESILQAFRCMASGPQLDIQREQRWPDQTEVHVQFKAWDGNPKYADLEGIIPPVKSC
ncbi:hypothetical protein B0H15DRAFT_134153 [Mycena belliarum]|uniref:Gfd2/YDR514C-like C-terminal domain-containing protein n=1 Tax=Mycena belliarum TaxID=1033014 RepID=A0AAD6XRR6_9AGAR|nr:hypothetical protein B0H15DRAFT_134153 [Mycena belliae]